MRPTVLLFDIDGTLLTSGGAGRRAMDRAFSEVCGHDDACVGFSMAGMTDRGIVRAGLQAIGHEDADATIDAVLERYLDLLGPEVASADGYRVLPGVETALDLVSGESRFAIGLGTGNVRPGAQIKLGRVGLFDQFAFGGFGCDDEDRGRLIGVGFDRGARALGLPREACRLVVIGDTPRDAEAARANGASCLAVATGSHGVDELTACGATWVFADLTAAGALDALLG